VAAFVVLQLGALSSAGLQRSAEGRLDTFGRAMVGTWTGAATFTEDIPGVGKKGEKYSTTLVCSWAAGRAAVRCDGKEPQSTWAMLYYWDAGSRQIGYIGVNSGGGSGLGTVARGATSYTATEVGSTADGSRLDATYEIVFGNDGKSRTDTGTTIIKGVRTAWRDVYTKQER
jgi:hypothetical protein